MFSSVFENSSIAIFASMITYLFAQFVDIQIYHFWKRLTKGKQLWLRNNFSTWFSQFVDTITILTLLCLFGIIPWENFKGLLISAFLFRKRFNLKVNDEIELI